VVPLKLCRQIVISVSRGHLILTLRPALFRSLAMRILAVPAAALAPVGTRVLMALCGL